MFVCTLLELHICNKGKINASSLIRINVKNDKRLLSMFQNFIFRYYHKVDVKHVTISNYAFLYIPWQTACELVYVWVYVWSGGYS